MSQSQPGRAIWIAGVFVVALVGAAAWWAGRTEPADESSRAPEVIDAIGGTEVVAVPPELPAVPPPEALVASLPEPHPPQRSEPLAITVIDGNDAPVVDALVEVWDPPSRRDAMREAIEKSGLPNNEEGKLAGEALKQFLKDFRLPDPTWEPPRLTLRTGNDGRCELGDPASTTILVASKKDVGTSGIWAAVAAPMTLRLQPIGRIHGVVTDSEDRPVANATVRMSVANLQLGDGGARTPQSVQSNERGEFEVAVDAGVLGSATAFRGLPEERSSEEVFSVQAGETEVVVLLFAQGTISGRVEWDDGEPVGRAMLEANLEYKEASGGENDPMRFAHLDEDGSFLLEHLRPGRRYWLHVGTSSPAWVSADRHDVPTGATGVVLVLARKDAEGATLRGRVVDMETGAPVPEFETILSPWGNGFRGQNPRPRTAAHKNEGGRFELPRLPAARCWAVEIHAPDHEPAIFGPIRPAEQQEFEFAIGRAGKLSVEIVDVDGHPVAGAKVGLFKEVTSDGRDLTSPEQAAVTDKAGRVKWESLPPGRRWLTARSASGRLGPVSVTVPSGDTGSVRAQLDDRQPASSIAVQVFDREGRPVTGVNVNFGLVYGTGDTGEAASPTDSSGVAVAQDLRPGIYAVSMHSDDLWILPRYFVVEPGAALRVELRQ